MLTNLCAVSWKYIFKIMTLLCSYLIIKNISFRHFYKICLYLRKYVDRYSVQCALGE